MDQQIISVETEQVISSDCFYLDKKKHERDIYKQLDEPLKTGWNLVTKDPVTTNSFSGWFIPPGETVPHCLMVSTTNFILEKEEAKS